jgi:hypothetical protein
MPAAAGSSNTNPNQYSARSNGDGQSARTESWIRMAFRYRAPPSRAGLPRTTTDVNGVFSFSSISLSSRFGFVQRSLNQGFFTGSRSIITNPGASNYVNIQLIPMNGKRVLSRRRRAGRSPYRPAIRLPLRLLRWSKPAYGRCLYRDGACLCHLPRIQRTPNLYINTCPAISVASVLTEMRQRCKALG